MRKRVQMVLAAAGLLSGLAVGSALAQAPDKMSADKMSGMNMPDKKMSHEAMMEKMNKMSAEDKAAMFDKMSQKGKMAAMKMSGKDMTKMSSTERMDMMGKMSAQDKADMIDKMPMEKKMAMMNGGHMKHKKPMGGMDKM